MTTPPAKFKCTQPNCDKEYKDRAHLGIHLRAAHGIAGKSLNAVKSRNKRELAAAAIPADQAKAKRKYNKRSTSLATTRHETNGQAHHTTINGQAHQITSRRFTTEAALAVAYVRYQELCSRTAFEYDLPPRTFAAQLRDVIAAETLR
jgi:hypothetical protein